MSILVSRIERKESSDRTRRAGIASFVIRGLEDMERCVRVRLRVVRMKILGRDILNYVVQWAKKEGLTIRR
jgi:hypothetical protein